MIPYGNFTFFGLALYAVIPTIVLGLFGRAHAWWTILVTGVALLVQFSGVVEVRPDSHVSEIWIVVAYAVWQFGVARTLLRWKTRRTGPTAIALAILPLAAAKFLPALWPETVSGFLGISYVTFRALDVVFSIKDGVIKALPPLPYFGFLFFYPTLSSGPIDRFRRFTQDLQRRRTRAEFLLDLDAAVQRIFQGFLYKFIIGALLKTHWLDRIAVHGGARSDWEYMYCYTFYLFFDFAGYSAFAIAFSRLLGIHTPENFNLPFIASNIRDFWNRWHISLSFWFRDHVYMRFLLAAGKGKWFKNKHTASYVGLFVTFGLMGIWHGFELHYLLYGAYHGALLSGYDWFARWNKRRKVWGDTPLWRAGNLLLTFHAVAFGLLLFSGRITPHPPPRHEEVVETIDCDEIVGWAWDRQKPNEPLTIDVFVDSLPAARISADELRSDLLERRFGNGRHGFRWAVPDWMRDGRPHAIELRVAENGFRVRGTPEVLACPPR